MERQKAIYCRSENGEYSIQINSWLGWAGTIFVYNERDNEFNQVDLIFGSGASGMHLGCFYRDEKGLQALNTLFRCTITNLYNLDNPEYKSLYANKIYSALD